MVISTLKGMEKKHTEGRMDIKKARYEVWLARAQLEEIQKSVIAEKVRLLHPSSFPLIKQS